MRKNLQLTSVSMPKKVEPFRLTWLLTIFHRSLASVDLDRLIPGVSLFLPIPASAAAASATRAIIGIFRLPPSLVGSRGKVRDAAGINGTVPPSSSLADDDEGTSAVAVTG